MKFDLTKLLLCAGIILALIVGRCTAPKPEPDHRTEDSLKRVIALKHLKIEAHRKNANKAFQRGLESAKAKVVVKIKYVRDTARNHALPLSKKDTLIKQVLGVPVSDSSKFTNQVANKVLDLATENVLLEESAKIDSNTIAFKDSGIKELEAALEQSGLESSTKDNLITEARNETTRAKKEARKQRRLKVLAFGVVAVIGTISIAK